MKRTMKLITSLCLSVLLILSTLGISAFAATPKPHKNLKYRQYCYLGDSIPFGYGLVSQAESSDWKRPQRQRSSPPLLPAAASVTTGSCSNEGSA